MCLHTYNELSLKNEKKLNSYRKYKTYQQFHVFGDINYIHILIQPSPLCFAIILLCCCCCFAVVEAASKLGWSQTPEVAEVDL